jgi:hypothetical protein
MEEDINIFDSAFCREFKRLHDSYSAEIELTKLKRKEGRLAYQRKNLNSYEQARVVALGRLEPGVDIFEKVKKISGQSQNYEYLKNCVETSGEFYQVAKVYDLYRALKCNKDRRGRCSGKPILHQAIIKKKIYIVILLLAVKACIGYDYATGKTALDVACEAYEVDKTGGTSFIKLILYAYCLFNEIKIKDFLQGHRGKSIKKIALCVSRDQHEKARKIRWW